MKLTLVYLARDRYRPLISPVVLRLPELLRRIRRFECTEAEKFFPVSAYAPRQRQRGEEGQRGGGSGDWAGALSEASGGARRSAK